VVRQSLSPGRRPGRAAGVGSCPDVGTPAARRSAFESLPRIESAAAAARTPEAGSPGPRRGAAAFKFKLLGY
jgi:hypothetical protein